MFSAFPSNDDWEIIVLTCVWNMKHSNEGQVRKTLSVSPTGNDGDYFFKLGKPPISESSLHLLRFFPGLPLTNKIICTFTVNSHIPRRHWE